MIYILDDINDWCYGPANTYPGQILCSRRNISFLVQSVETSPLNNHQMCFSEYMFRGFFMNKNQFVYTDHKKCTNIFSCRGYAAIFPMGHCQKTAIYKSAK